MSSKRISAIAELIREHLIELEAVTECSRVQISIDIGDAIISGGSMGKKSENFKEYEHDLACYRYAKATVAAIEETIEAKKRMGFYKGEK